MSDYDDAVNHLLTLLEQHPSTQAFKAVQADISQRKELNERAAEMKERQQDAVLFRKIGKKKAAQSAIEQAKTIQKELDHLPIITDYRAKMQDANDLLQYVTKSIEEKINEALTHDD